MLQAQVGALARQVRDVQRTLRYFRLTSAERAALRAIDAGYRKLTRRGLQVLEPIVAGLSNRQVAQRTGISQRTVEFHRANIMRKMGAHTLADLVRMAVWAWGKPEPDRPSRNSS